MIQLDQIWNLFYFVFSSIGLLQLWWIHWHSGERKPPLKFSCKQYIFIHSWFSLNCLPILSLSKGKLSDMKSTWSPGPISQSQASLSHELWKVPQGPRNTTAPSRPPPGLTNNKPSSTWGGNSLGLSQGWSGSYSSGEHRLEDINSCTIPSGLSNQPAITAACQNIILKEF